MAGIGDWTTEKLQSLGKRAKEIAKALGIPEDQAWVRMQEVDTQKVLETVERMETYQRQIAQAEMQALSARANTYRTKIEGGNKK